MEKDNLRSLVTQMYEELIENIDTQESATKEQVILFLQDAITAISSMNLEDINSVDISFKNAYKDLTNESIFSYKNTNDRFDEITKIHAEVLDEFQAARIDLPKITERFENVHTHMKEEISRANAMISDLIAKVKILETDSNIDSLTNIFNRRALSTYLHNICNNNNLHQELHLLILDIDDFKHINDTFGHIAGDKILIFIANILRRTLRDGDKVFRYGGEEFVVVLNRISNDVCLQVTQRLLKIVSSNQLIYKGNTLNVTMSIGATLYHQNDTPESLIARADKALYKSKNGGKNQMNVELI